MDDSTYEIIELIVWIVGIGLLATGCSLLWGWPASLVVIGGILSIWPLVKTVARLK